MRLKVLSSELSVCKLPMDTPIALQSPYTFVSRTDEELSLVCPTTDVPALTLAREDGWKGFRIEGELDFGLVGILSRIASILAQRGIPIFAISTYNTDYILTKAERFQTALRALEEEGYQIQS